MNDTIKDFMHDFQIDLLLGAIKTIKRKQEKVSFTKDELKNELNKFFSKNIDLFISDFPEIVPHKDEIKNILITKFLENNKFSIEPSTVFKEEQDQRQWWLSQNDEDHVFSQSYKRFLLEEKHFLPKSVAEIMKVSDEVMDMIGNPKGNNNFQKRGLIVGDVQSGKTALYTAICNKAIDAGYEIIVVLAGLTDSLREQTQNRLDIEFVGQYKDKDSAIAKYRVGAKTRVFRATKSNDFNKAKLDSDATFPILFVSKKNKSILNNILKALQKDIYKDKSILFIDDEADSASINTNDEDTSPTAINDCINKILKNFDKASYIGVTATPYANIFCKDELDENNKPIDIFPRDFIVKKGAPQDYIGAAKIFNLNFDSIPAFKINNDKKACDALAENGDNGKYYDQLVPIYNEEQEDFFCYKHKKELAQNLIDLPDSLKEAICYFVIANCLCTIRGVKEKHRTMLINVSRFTDVHETIQTLVSNFVGELYNSTTIVTKTNLHKEDKYIALLEKVFNENTSHILDFDVDFDDLLANNKIFNEIKQIKIKTVNQKSKDVDEEGNKVSLKYDGNGKRYIAIGGLSLSRGLTLEGLIVSYFYRNTQMYDSLMQMGRWFGYRPGYDDLFKIWIGEDSIDWYTQVATSDYELNLEINHMNDCDLTPDKYVMKVRCSPGNLLVTARNKMRTAETFKVPQNITGRLVETARIINDKDIISANNKLCREFLSDLGEKNAADNTEVIRDTESSNNILIKNISKDLIVSLVKNYKCHPWNLSFNSEGLSDFIKKSEKSELNIWDAVIVGGLSSNTEDVTVYGQTFNVHLARRAISLNEDFKEMLKISDHRVRVGSADCTKHGLTLEQRKLVEDRVKQYRRSPYASDYLNVEGRNPLLLIYLVESSNKKLDIENPIYAIGLGFPGAKDLLTTEYVIQSKDLKRYSFDDEDKDDE